MKAFFKKNIANAIFIVLALFLLITAINKISCLNNSNQFAAVIDLVTSNNATTTSGFAWNDNVGWINFGDDSSDEEGRVYVSDNKLYGYAWGENIGWISMNCDNDDSCDSSNYGVTQNESDGTLTGKAWGENIGWIDFAPTGGGVTISTSTSGINTFSGYAWGENIGWISFSGNSPNYGVTTNWVYPTYNLIYTAGSHGTITGSSTQIIPKGGSGTAVTATPNTGYHFTTWSDGATTTSRTDTNITENTSLTANFAINTYTLTYIAGDNGTITGSSTQIVNYGADGAEVIATPNSGYHFVSWSDEATTSASRIDTNITENVTTTSTFARSGGSRTPTCIYNDPAWSICSLTGSQTRTLTATNQTCIGDDPKIESQSCTPVIEISINPSATTTIFTGDKIQFIATVTGTTTTGVNWTVFPITLDDYYGTIDDQGLYTAPDNIRELSTLNLQIIATAQADITKKVTTGIIINKKSTCTDYTYSDWGPCINNLQTRTVSNSIPENCLGGITATTSQSCAIEITATSTPCISYTYSDWSDCLNNIQTRITLTSVPENCLGGEQAENERSCIVEPTIIVPEVIVDNNDTTNTNSDNNNHSSGGSGSDSGIISNLSENINQLIAQNITVLGTTTEMIYLNAKKIAESPTGAVVTNTITTAGIVGGGVAATSALVINGTVATDLLFLPFRLWGLLLSALGLRKRNRPWGTVYDSVTKQPIDPAYVNLKNLIDNKESMSITDLDGRYGFLVAPGKYTLSANKTNYIFPSTKLAGKTEDALYNNLYFGEEINVDTTGALISKNIPLDPVKFDWNEFVKGKKNLMKFYSRREKIIRIVTDWIFRLGLIISIASLLLVTAPYNLIIFGLYLVLVILRKFGLKQKTLGYLTDKNGDPLCFAIIRIFDSELNVEITNKVADKIGRYYCLVNKGKYYVKIEKKNDDESYSLIYTSPIFENTNGIINQNYTV